MEQTGILVSKLSEHSGVSQKTGNAWRNAEFLMEVPGQRTVYVNFVVADGQAGRISLFEKFVGKTVTVSFDIEAREYNGRWYNDLKAWGCKDYAAGQAAVARQAVANAAGTVAAGQTAQVAGQAAAPITGDGYAEQMKLKLTQMVAASGNEGKEGEGDGLPF